MIFAQKNSEGNNKNPTGTRLMTSGQNNLLVCYGSVSGQGSTDRNRLDPDRAVRSWPYDRTGPEQNRNLGPDRTRTEQFQNCRTITH